MRRALPVLLLLLPISLYAVETPPRLFFSDARLSFLVPEPWTVPSSFPIGPVLTRKTQEGTDAFILCQISDPVDSKRLSADISDDALKSFATDDIQSRAKNGRILASSARTLAGQNAYEVTWLSDGSDGTVQYQSIYFFMESRFYMLSLRAQRESFPWIVQEFQDWLQTVRILTRQDSGQLDTPAHGGLWVHQSGGAKMAFPEEWLIGVADDRQVAAALAHENTHLDFSAVVEVMGPGTQDITAEEKTAARRTLTQKSYTVTAESEEPFHGYPCYRIAYENTIDGRFVRGEDLWVASPRARWLISVDGDGAFFRQMTDQWQGILNGIQFNE